MGSYQHDLFKTLINKLNLPSSLKCFQNGQVNKLIIHDQSNRWLLYVTLNTLMPYQIFKKFNENVMQLMNKATISLVFKVNDTKLNLDLVKDYWPWVIQNCGLSSIMAQQLGMYGHLQWVNNHLWIATKNEALRGFLINGALVRIEDGYHRLGFPQFNIHVLGRNTKRPAKVVNFNIKKNDDDVKLARRAVKALDKDSSK